MMANARKGLRSDAGPAVVNYIPGKPAMKLWRLMAKDINEPPFHFAGVARMYVIAASTEEEARYLAALCSEPHGPVWMDDDMTDCVVLAPSGPGVIAQG